MVNYDQLVYPCCIQKVLILERVHYLRCDNKRIKVCVVMITRMNLRAIGAKNGIFFTKGIPITSGGLPNSYCQPFRFALQLGLKAVLLLFLFIFFVFCFFFFVFSINLETIQKNVS